MHIVEEKDIIREIEDKEIRYLYSITEQEYNNMQVYGIRVRRDDFKEGKRVSTDEDRVEIISPKFEKVKKIFNYIYKGEVSPIHLIDIIGEEVDKCVFDF